MSWEVKYLVGVRNLLSFKWVQSEDMSNNVKNMALNDAMTRGEVTGTDIYIYIKKRGIRGR